MAGSRRGTAASSPEPATPTPGPQTGIRLLKVELVFVLVTLSASRFEVEHEVLHVEPELAEGVLNERENPAPADCALDNAVKSGCELSRVLRRQGPDGGGELLQSLGSSVVVVGATREASGMKSLLGSNACS